MTQQIAIFTASGHAQVERLSGEVNLWIKSEKDNIDVVSITPNLCTTGVIDEGEMIQFMTITVVYQER